AREDSVPGATVIEGDTRWSTPRPTSARAMATAAHAASAVRGRRMEKRVSEDMSRRYGPGSLLPSAATAGHRPGRIRILSRGSATGAAPRVRPAPSAYDR